MVLTVGRQHPQTGCVNKEGALAMLMFRMTPERAVKGRPAPTLLPLVLTSLFSERGVATRTDDVHPCHAPSLPCGGIGFKSWSRGESDPSRGRDQAALLPPTMKPRVCGPGINDYLGTPDSGPLVRGATAHAHPQYGVEPREGRWTTERDSNPHPSSWPGPCYLVCRWCPGLLGYPPGRGALSVTP